MKSIQSSKKLRVYRREKVGFLSIISYRSPRIGGTFKMSHKAYFTLRLKLCRSLERLWLRLTLPQPVAGRDWLDGGNSGEHESIEIEEAILLLAQNFIHFLQRLFRKSNIAKWETCSLVCPNKNGCVLSVWWFVIPLHSSFFYSVIAAASNDIMIVVAHWEAIE